MLRGVVYLMNSSGPRSEPWGTPQEEVCQDASKGASKGNSFWNSVLRTFSENFAAACQSSQCSVSLA